MNKTILIADDDAAIRTVLEQALQRKGHQVKSTDTPVQLLEWVKQGVGDAVISDVLMPGGNGLDGLNSIKQIRPDLPVIVISAQSNLMTAVKATERGAYDYLAKPFDLNALVSCVENALAHDNQPSVTLPPSDLPLIGKSPAMQDVFRSVARLTTVDLTVLIEGESGTGKELIARALHTLGTRKDRPFVAINMAAIPKELVESELFGHEKGAFTGANARKTGLFEQAGNGTLFLDEIGDMPLDAQTKLLRVLQQGEFSPVGSTRCIKTSVRIICATHRDLRELVQTGQFREDLFYRLNVVPIHVPALRERREDIGELVEFFLRKATERGLAYKHLQKDAKQVLEQHEWPGNVRELENAIYRLAALSASQHISAEEVRATLSNATPSSDKKQHATLEDSVREHLRAYFAAHKGSAITPGLYDRVLELVERPLIELTLKATNGNQLKAAALLGINRNTLRKKIGELGIGARDNNDESSAA